ncbi:MAG: hypothetical protein EXS13_03670 [Planctomycetes bacterium]|nr:hypothetical protein [Planctomycetota bacterium]
MQTAPLTRKLESLRARLRSRWIAAGSLRLFAELSAFLVTQFAIDRFLWLPIGARRFVGAVATLLFAWRFAVLLLRPMRKRVAARDVALAVERRHPALQGGLASMVEVEAAGGLPADASPELLEQWRAAVAARADALDFDAIFDHRLLRRLGGVSAAALLLIGGFAVLRPVDARIFLARLAGADVPWPRRTRLELDVAAASTSTHFRVDRDADGRAERVIVARGASLPIVARAAGTVPDEVMLLIREEGRSSVDELRMAPRDGAAREFVHRFGNTLRAMQLSAAGGDDPGEGLSLEIIVVAPPLVERLVATITPPAYTGRSPLREERQEFAVPAGTMIDLEVATSGEVAEASLTLHSDPGTMRVLERDANTKDLWRGRVVAEESGTINLHLLGKSGFKNLRPIDVPMTVLADRKPTVETVRPAVSDLEVTARAVVPVRLLVDDDYGVTLCELLLLRSDDPAVSRIVLQGDGSVRPAPLLASGEPHVLDGVLDLKELTLAKGIAPAPIAEGDSLIYSARLEDNRESPPGTAAHQVTSSPTRRIDVVTDGEKLRKLTDRQQRVKGAVSAAKKSQEERFAGLQSLLAAQGDGGIETKELTALEVEQGRVGTGARQAARDLADVAGEFTLNRLDPTPSAERAVQYLLARLVEAKSGPNFDFAPYSKFVAAHTAGEFGELQQLGALLVMVDLGLQASEQHAQRALEQLRSARLSGRPEDRLGRLKEAQLAQQRVIETFALLLQKMEEWEDFQEILDLWRGLVNDQRDLNEWAREGAASGSGTVPAGGADGGGRR